MSAPLGNNFWNLRSKHGRDRLFGSPEELWEAACEYFEWCERNPLIEIDFRGSGLDKIELPKVRAFTMQGLCRYLDCNIMYFNHFERDLRNKEDQLSKDFTIIIHRIKETLFEQKFTHAAAGFLNANLISRELGLKDSSEITGANGAPLMAPQPAIVINQMSGLPALGNAEEDLIEK